jgi:HEAT repeat protein
MRIRDGTKNRVGPDRTKRARIPVALLLATVILGTIWLVRRGQEPVYHGKPLRFWLQACSLGSAANGTNGPTREQADEALRQLGPKAVPTLLQMLRAHDSAWIRLVQKQQIIKISRSRPDDLNYMAGSAFAVLGTSASNAAPALIQIFDQKLSPMSRANAAEALGSIGPAAEKAIPSLLHELGNTNRDSTRTSCALALGMIHRRAEVVVPILTRLLADPNPNMRNHAAIGLAGFGSEAKSAVPALVKHLDDPLISRNVELALKRATGPRRPKFE